MPEMETRVLMGKRDRELWIGDKAVNKLSWRKRKNSFTGHLRVCGSHICLVTAPKTTQDSFSKLWLRHAVLIYLSKILLSP